MAMLRCKDLYMSGISDDNNILQLVNETVDLVVFRGNCGCKGNNYDFTEHLCAEIIEEIFCNACDKVNSSCYLFNSSQSLQKLKSSESTPKKENIKQSQLISCAIGNKNMQNSVSAFAGSSTNNSVILAKLMEAILQKVTFDSLPSQILAKHNHQSVQQNCEINKQVLSQPIKLERSAFNHILSSSYPTTFFSTSLSFTQSEPIPGSTFSAEIELQLSPDSVESIAQKSEDITLFTEVRCDEPNFSFDSAQKKLLGNDKDKVYKSFLAEQSSSIACLNTPMPLKDAKSCSDSFIVPAAIMPSNSPFSADVKPQVDISVTHQDASIFKQPSNKLSKKSLTLGDSMPANSSILVSQVCLNEDKLDANSSITISMKEPSIKSFTAESDNKHAIVEDQIEGCDMSLSDPEKFEGISDNASGTQQQRLIQNDINSSQLHMSAKNEDTSYQKSTFSYKSSEVSIHACFLDNQPCSLPEQQCKDTKKHEQDDSLKQKLNAILCVNSKEVCKYDKIANLFCDNNHLKKPHEHADLSHDQKDLLSQDHFGQKACFNSTLLEESCLLDTERKCVISCENCEEGFSTTQDSLIAQASNLREGLFGDDIVSKITQAGEKVKDYIAVLNDNNSLFKKQDQSEKNSAQSSPELLLNMENLESCNKSINSPVVSNDEELQLDMHKSNDLSKPTMDLSTSSSDLVLEQKRGVKTPCIVSNDQFDINNSRLAVYCTAYTQHCTGTSPIKNQTVPEQPGSVSEVETTEYLSSHDPECGLNEKYVQEKKSIVSTSNCIQNHLAFTADMLEDPQGGLHETNTNNILEFSIHNELSQEETSMFKKTDGVFPKFSESFLALENKLCQTPSMQTPNVDFSYMSSGNAVKSSINLSCEKNSSAITRDAPMSVKNEEISLITSPNSFVKNSCDYQLSPVVSESIKKPQSLVSELNVNLRSAQSKFPTPRKNEKDNVSCVRKSDLLECGSIDMESNNESWLKIFNDAATPIHEILVNALIESPDEYLHGCENVHCLGDDNLNSSCLSGEELFSEIQKDAVVPDGKTNYSFQTSDELVQSDSAVYNSSLKSTALDDSFFADKLCEIASPQVDQFMDDCNRVKSFVSPAKGSDESNLMKDENMVSFNNVAMQNDKALIPTALVNTSSGQLVMRCPQTEKKEVHKILDWKPWAWKRDDSLVREVVSPGSVVSPGGVTKDFNDLLSPLLISTQEVELLTTDEYEAENTSGNDDKVEVSRKLSSQNSEKMSGAFSKQKISMPEQSYRDVNSSNVSDLIDASTLQELCAAELKSDVGEEEIPGIVLREEIQELVQGDHIVGNSPDHSKSSRNEIFTNVEIEETHSVAVDDNDISFYDSKFSDEAVKYSMQKQSNRKMSFCEAFGAIENSDLSPRKRRNCDLTVDQIPSVPEMNKISPKMPINPTVLDQEVPTCYKVVNYNLEDKRYPDACKKLSGISQEVEEESGSDEEFERTTEDDGLMNYDDCYLIRRPVRSNPFLRHSTTVQSNHIDKLYRISPLKTCGGPRRVGLSRRRKVTPLHHHKASDV